MKKRRIIFLIIMVLTVVSLTGCGKDTDLGSTDLGSNDIEKEVKLVDTEFDKNVIVAEVFEDATEEFKDDSNVKGWAVEEPEIYRINEVYIFDAANNTLVEYHGEEKDIVVPSKFIIEDREYNVEIIGPAAYFMDGITSLELHEGLREIQGSSFFMNKLTKVDIPSSVEIIYGMAFDKNNISELNIPETSQLKEIKSNAFSNNNIKEVNLPESLEYLRKSVFDNNNITKINIPSKVRVEEFISDNPLEEVVIESSAGEFLDKLLGDTTPQDIFGDAKITYNK